MRPKSSIAVSARQFEIVRMVASGATDREVADALGVSPRTISNTLTRLYNKVGVSSRAYLAGLYARGQVRILLDSGKATRRPVKWPPVVNPPPRRVHSREADADEPQED